MPVYVKEYYGEPGLNYITDPALSHVTILGVARNGTVHNLTLNESAEKIEFVYSISGGAIVFDPLNPFTGPTGDRPDRRFLERVKVKYKV